MYHVVGGIMHILYDCINVQVKDPVSLHFTLHRHQIGFFVRTLYSWLPRTP